MTNEPETVKCSVAAIRNFCEKNEVETIAKTRIIGIHMEGPFLGEKKKGAHDSRYLLAPDIEFYKEMQELSGGRVRLIAIDPELPSAEELMRKCK